MTAPFIFCTERVTDRVNFMLAEEAKEFGLVDHVLSHQLIDSKEGEPVEKDSTDASSSPDS